jgi:hypothetical protein
VLGSVMSFGPIAEAGTVIQVTTTQQKIGGPGGCSLQEAILAANHDSSSFTAPANDAVVIHSACAAGSGADIIELLPNAVFAMDHVIDDTANYTGPAATPIITSEMIIEGHGARIERTTPAAMRAFAVLGGGALDLREIHVKGFAAQGGNGAGGGGGGLGAGGAIYVHAGSLLVQWSTFEANSASGGNGSGGNTTGAGGGGGGLGGSGGSVTHSIVNSHVGGAGGGGARGRGGDGDFAVAGMGGGTVAADFRCGGQGGSFQITVGFDDGDDGSCAGGGGGGGGSENGISVGAGSGGDGNYGGGGGGGGYAAGDGGHGGFGGGGGAGPAFSYPDGWSGGSGGDAGFGGGGGAGPGGTFFGDPGVGGSFAGNGGEIAGGGGAGLGGAIFGHDAAVDVSNSTFYGNYAVRGVAGGEGAQNGTDAGGAIFTVGGSLRVRNSTVSGNESTGDGAGIVVYAPASFGQPTFFALANTIVAGNTGRDECFVVGNVQTAGSNNLVTPHANDAGAACPGITQTGDPVLGALQLNAPGHTPTMAPDAASPAIDSGDPTGAPTDDQRGIPRPYGAGVDIGAYEYDGPPMPTDLTAPTAAPSQTPPANAAGWNNSQVTVAWNWVDEAGGSGIDAAACTTTSSTAGEGAGIPLAATCADIVGNAAVASYSVNVDATAPTVTCAAAPVYTIGGSHDTDVTATVTDALSGPVATSVATDVTAADVATAGARSVSLTGADVAGNTTAVSCTYVVAYRFGGLLEPIPQSSYKRGSTIPIKFRLTNASAVPITDAAALALLAPPCNVRITVDGSVAGCARYNATTDTFQFDVKTSKTIAEGTHTIGVIVTAGTAVVNSAQTTVLIRR